MKLYSLDYLVKQKTYKELQNQSKTYFNPLGRW